MERTDPEADAALDAAIAARGLVVPEASLAAVRDGIRRLAASAARLRACGFGDPGPGGS